MEFKIDDFIGERTNIPKPSGNACETCQNLEVHRQPGKLTLRPGYVLRYPKPTDSRITEIEYLSFDNFYDKQTPNAAEITCLISKGVVSSPVDGITDTLNTLQVWIRPYFTGVFWLDQWQWLNEIVITKIISDTSSPYYNRLTVAGNYNLTGWTVINKTKGTGYFGISKPKRILQSQLSGSNTIVDTSQPSDYVNVQNDIVIFMRNYIPYNYLLTMYQVTRKDITFHRLLNDLRIGFGGKEGRIGLSVGYRKKYYAINEIDWPNVPPEYSEEAPLLNIREINKVCLDPYTEFNFTKNNVVNFRLNYTITTGGSLAAGDYYLKMTGVIDDVSEVLLIDNAKVEVPAEGRIKVFPAINMGAVNKRLTKIKVYFSNDEGTTFLLYKTWELTKLTNDGKNFDLDHNGDLIAIESPGTNLYIETSAAAPTDDNAVGSWGVFVLGTISVQGSSPYNLRMTQSGIGSPTGGTHLLVDMTEINGVNLREIIKPGSNYDISVSLNIDSGTANVQVGFITEVGSNFKTIAITNTPTTYTISVQAPAFLTDVTIIIEAIGGFANGRFLEWDAFTIIESAQTYIDGTNELGATIAVEMGYQPTFNLVKDWSHAIISKGRTHVLNPYVNETNPNKIFSSHIAAGFSYDAISAQRVTDIEKFDGNLAIGMALLAGLNVVVVKDNASLIVDLETNAILELGHYTGGKSREGIVSLKDMVIWPSDDDVLKLQASSSTSFAKFIDDNLTDQHIRDQYQAIADKSGIIAIRDKYNCYRMVSNDPVSKLEFLLTDRGWIRQVKTHYPEVYRLGVANTIWFLNEGDIYSFPYTIEEFVGYADVYGDYRSGY